MLKKQLMLAFVVAAGVASAADLPYDAVVSAAEGARIRNDAAQTALSDACSLTDYTAKVKSVDGTNVWTEAFRDAVRDHEIVRIPRGEYFVDGTVVLRSNRRIEAAAGAVIRMMPPMDTCFFVNDGARDGLFAPVDKSAANANIAVVGGRWEDWRRRRFAESTTGRWSDGVTKGGGRKSPWHGVSALMYVGNAKGVTFRDITLVHASSFGIQTGDVEDFVCERLSLEQCHADGLHVNGNVRNVLVRDVQGEVGDDLVALNFCDWPCSSVNFGPGENILVEKLRRRGGPPWFRLFPAVHHYRDGSSVDCAARNIVVRDVRGVSEFKMYLQTRRYEIGKGLRDRMGVGSGGNLFFEDIEFAWDGPDANADDPLRAHRGVFQIGANLEGVRIRNVRATMPADNPFAHLVCIGPISWISDKGKKPVYEIMDPWVSCTVSGLTIENVVYPTGAPAEPVHCTVFDNVNGDGLSSGRGHVVDDAKGHRTP